MKQKINILSLLIVLLTILAPNHIYAKTDGMKDEVVYALLEEDGGVNDIYVVNTFENEKEGKRTDYGSYTEVTNLTDLSPIQQTEDEITFQADKGKFHYEGQLDSRELPWDFTITYQHNGKEVKPDTLGGIDGEVDIIIETAQNKEIPAVFFEHYVLQINLSFPLEKTKEITAEKATVANAGENKQVTYTVMPDEEEKLVTTINTSDFTMDGIEIAAVPASFDFDMPDSSDFEKQMRQLAKAIVEIDKGTGDLTEGITDLHHGAEELTSGSSQFQRGLNVATNEIADATNEMEASFHEANEMMDGLAAIDFDQFDAYLEEMGEINQHFDNLIAALKEWKETVDEANDKIDHWLDSLPNDTITKEEMEALYETDADPEVIDQLIAAYEASQTVASELEEWKDGGFIDSEGLDDIITELEDAKDMADELATMVDGLTDGASIEDSLKQARETFEEFEAGITELQTGMEELATNYTAIHEGILGLSSGTASLEDGANELYDGTSALRKETKDLPGEMSAEMEELMEAYDFSDFELQSFVSEKNTNIESVQFVMKTSKIEAATEKAEEPETAPKKSLWQKFLDLFR